MKRLWYQVRLLGIPTVLVLQGVGCQANRPYVAPPAPLGSTIDPILRDQEINAEASKYVIYMHEFELNEAEVDGTNRGGWRLNAYGEDHLKQVAVNLKQGHEFPIVVERSDTSSLAGTKYGYPVHLNDTLDENRRQVVVAALTALGVEDAESLVIVGPAFAEGLPGSQAAQAYVRGLNSQSGFGFGGGGAGGGFGGGGTF